MLYVLWDLGLTIGHAVRSVADCLRLAAADETVATALIDARLVAGDTSRFDDLRRQFTGWLSNDHAFVRAILSERDKRHRHMGDSRYVVEPNVKHGKGGLRDLHTLYWIARARCRVRTMHALVSRGWLTEAEYRRCLAAQRFLWTVRCHLHFLADRAEERLTFDAQGEIAQRMGFVADSGARAVERFMKRYYLATRDVGDLSRILVAEITGEPRRRAERRMIGEFAVENERLTLRSDAEFARDPTRMLRLFHVAETHGIEISPHALRLVIRNQQRIDGNLRADPEANRLFVDVLTSRRDPESALRCMNEARILGRFIPEFGRVVAQTQHDTYHVYTVDEHTIRAVGVLSKIEQGAMRDILPLATTVFPEILSRRVLFLAVFLHDIAKGRGGDHSVLGAELARTLAPRLGFTDKETETVSWAGAPPLAVQPHGVQARRARPENGQRFRRGGAVVGAPPPALGADQGGHMRGRPQGVERLEGGAAPRTLCSRGGAHIRRTPGARHACSGRRGKSGLGQTPRRLERGCRRPPR